MNLLQFQQWNCIGPRSLMMAAGEWGFGMVSELVFYMLTAMLFAVGMWFAVNLLVALRRLIADFGTLPPERR
jgi:hypothetical protein